jgi:formylglycine-generating enzyme required for sulfatase activity
MHWPPLHPSVETTKISTAINSNVQTRPTAMPHVTTTTTTTPVEGVHYPSNAMIAVQSPDKATNCFTVELGKPANFPSFVWDNEYGTRTVHVPSPFSVSQYMISNGEYWQFVVDGYCNPDYWCAHGWAWRTHCNTKWPFFWKPTGPEGLHEYQLRTIFELVPMPWNWPVDVSFICLFLIQSLSRVVEHLRHKEGDAMLFLDCFGMNNNFLSMIL